MAYRSEMTIPVNKDDRTLEQRRDDMFTKLERSYSNESSSKMDGNTTTKLTTEKSVTRTSNQDANMFHDNAWDMEVSDWLLNRRKKWNEDISNMKRNMFKLEPNEKFSTDNWDSFGALNMGETRHSSTQVSEQSSTTTTIRDGERQSQTTQSSTSKAQTSGAGLDLGTKDNAHFNKDTSFGMTKANNTNMLKDAYEVGEDGQVHFKIRFDAKDFKPENIHVTTQDGQLSVSAKQSVQTGSSSSTKEFSRSITLPASVEHEKFVCNLTDDGVLVLDAPVRSPEYRQITLRDGLGIKAISGDKATVGSSELVKLTGQMGPVVLPNGTRGNKIHVEVPVDSVFAPEDFCVRTESNKIHISGRHEVRTANSSSFKEFSRYYEVPETIDPMSVTANLIGSTLVVEAPLLSRQ